MKSDDLEQFVAEVEAFSARTGISASTISNRATGNTYQIEKLILRRERDADIMRRVRDYMEKVEAERSGIVK